LAITAFTRSRTITIFRAISRGESAITSEIYPTRIRAFAGAVGGAWQRVAAILGTNVVAWLLPYGTATLFLYFGGLALVGGVLSFFFFAVETKGKTLAELSP
jgi:MFS transporter, putative metabolite:H+ symporter